MVSIVLLTDMHSWRGQIVLLKLVCRLSLAWVDAHPVSACVFLDSLSNIVYNFNLWISVTSEYKGRRCSIWLHHILSYDPLSIEVIAHIICRRLFPGSLSCLTFCELIVFGRSKFHGHGCWFSPSSVGPRGYAACSFHSTRVLCMKWEKNQWNTSADLSLQFVIPCAWHTDSL